MKSLNENIDLPGIISITLASFPLRAVFSRYETASVIPPS